MLTSAERRLLILACCSWLHFQKSGLDVAPTSGELGICCLQKGNKLFPHPNLFGRDEEELRKSLSELADPNPKSIKRISSCSNPFLDFSQDSSIATYKHGLLVRKIHADPDCKKSECLGSPWEALGARGHQGTPELNGNQGSSHYVVSDCSIMPASVPCLAVPGIIQPSGSWKASPCPQRWERGRQDGEVRSLGVAPLPQDCVDKGRCPVV